MKKIYTFTALILCFLLARVASAESPIQPGDRIAIVGNTFADQLRIHGYLETLLLQYTRENPISIRNLGWAGDMLSARDRPTGFPTEESTLTAHNTDVIIACFGMGESFAGEEGLEEFKKLLKKFVASHAGKKYNGKSEVRLILVSPIACDDLGKLTPARDKRNRVLEAYTQAIKEVASDTEVPFVDLFEASLYLMDEPTGPKLTNNGIHLNTYGYWAISHAFYDQLTESNRASWLLRIDANAKSEYARGVEISELTTNGSGLSFQVTEKSTPKLRPPTDQTLPPQLESFRDTLIIENLNPGKYRLTIDKQHVATATAQAWAAGVAVDSSPAHQSAEAYLALVNDKNLQFTYSWKALNQVHIVGERRTSASGKELPKEVIEFSRLAKELDKALAKGVELKTRQWRVSRISK
ncbi:MAG: dehydrogenase [Blastopirellula sp.]|nr:MAG: dehydrogenase [Blastopirellula sp.]